MFKERQHLKMKYGPKRTPADSQLDPSKSIEEQFDLLRVADSGRYPCFFYLRGRRFVLELKDGENMIGSSGDFRSMPVRDCPFVIGEVSKSQWQY